MEVDGGSDEAFREWRRLLGNDRVLTGEQAQRRYTESTLGIERRRVFGILFPTTTEEVIAIVKIAARFRMSLYPISVGNNWGYGSRTPAADSCVVVDLSGMNRILNMNDELGLVTIEPGVTVKQLRDFLVERKLRFLSLSSGAGPHGSILGNILDRGYSATPYVDRSASLMALEAVLADGTMYRSAFEDGAPSHVSGYFKWGVGPYLDSLFAQSNFGIVTRATVALAAVPKKTEVFLISIKEREPMRNVIRSYRNSLQTLGSTIASMRIQSPRRTFTRLMPYSKNELTDAGILDDCFIDSTLRGFGLDGWLIVGAIHGDPRVVRSARRVIRDTFKPCAKRVRFFDARSVRFFTWLRERLPHRLKDRFAFLSFVQSYLRAATGHSVERNPLLPLWKRPSSLARGRSVDADFDLDPHCGFIFFSPVLPMSGERVERFLEIAEQICTKHGFEVLVAFNNFSERCLHVSLPILFDKDDPEEVTKAHQCYRGLFHACRAEDIRVHRAGIHAMDLVVDREHPFWIVAEKIKATLDPLNIMSPGRYSSYRSKDSTQ